MELGGGVGEGREIIRYVFTLPECCGLSFVQKIVTGESSRNPDWIKNYTGKYTGPESIVFLAHVKKM